ncbi:MAG: PA2169 family four-helix-bundle protein [Acidimicrobiia bacterium]
MTAMDTDSIGSVLEDLIETLEDGRKGFEQTADKLAEAERPDLAERMRAFSNQRTRYSAELRSLAAGEGITIDEDGSLAASMHRGWIALKDALSSNEAGAVLGAAETGEDAATRQYRDALAADLPPHIRAVVAEQAIAIEAAHDEVKALRDRETA